MLDLQLTERPIRSADESPIFIIGTGRSGTTLLRQMLNAHPRIHITHEAGFYSYARHAAPELSAAEWLERYFETFSFAWLRLDPAAVRAELPPDLAAGPLGDRVAEVCRAVMRCKARQQGKPRYGDKNPLDTHNLERIFADFPDARIVYITRDPRPTVSSFNRMPFGTSSSLLNSLLCRMQFDHIKPYFDRILEVRLEDLVADPGATLRSILNYVGEPFDEAVLDHVRHAEHRDVPPLPWFVDATRAQPNQKASHGSWREQLTPEWVSLVEWLNREAMQRYGYAPAELSPRPGFLRLVGAVLADVPRIADATYRLLSFKRKLDRHFQNEERLDAQRGMEENVRLNPNAWRYYPDFRMPQVPSLCGEVAAGR